MASPYRGGGTVAERVAALDKEIAALEARFTCEFWERVAPVWGVSRTPNGTLPQLEARQSLVEQLNQAKKQATAEPGAAQELPSLGIAPWRGPVGRILTPLWRGVERTIGAHTRNANWNHDLGQWVKRGKVDGVPIEMISSWGNRYRSVADIPFNLQDRPLPGVFPWMGFTPSPGALCLRTTVAPACQLSLSRESFFDAVLGEFANSEEIETHDKKFDSDFRIRGDKATADTLLTPRVRTDLHHICSMYTPTIHVGNGVAQIDGLVAGTEQCALRVLQTWHRAPSPVPLLHEEERPKTKRASHNRNSASHNRNSASHNRNST